MEYEKNFVLVLFFLFFLFFVFLYKQFIVVARINDFSVSMDFSYSVSWYRNENNEYYFFLPSIMTRDSLIPQMNLSDEDLLVQCFDEKGNKLGIITNLKKMDYLKLDTLYLKASKKGKKSTKYTIHIFQSDIPSIFISLEGGSNSYRRLFQDKEHTLSVPASFLLNSNTNEQIISNIQIRGRGNSTWLRPKKPYQIKFSNSISLNGNNKSRKFVFLTNHWDGSLSRNYLWFRLSRELGMEYAIDCFPSDVYLNGGYIGSYLVTNKLEKSPYSIDFSGGYLFEITNTMQYDILLDHGYRINIHYPNLKKKNSEIIKKEASRYLNKIEKLLYDSDVSLEELADYIDIDSFIQYYWVQEFSENYDVLRGSNYLYVKDNKLYIGPTWDMDDTLNRSYHFAKGNEDYILNNSALQLRIEENWYQRLFRKDNEPYGFRSA